MTFTEQDALYAGIKKYLPKSFKMKKVNATAVTFKSEDFDQVFHLDIGDDFRSDAIYILHRLIYDTDHSMTIRMTLDGPSRKYLLEVLTVDEHLIYSGNSYSEATARGFIDYMANRKPVLP